MNNKCKDCGKCCLETEMILSQRDIKLILSNFPNPIREEDFTLKNFEDQYQLKNKKGHCVFLEPTQKFCKIYEYRPQGCRFYPLIFDLNTNNSGKLRIVLSANPPL